MSARIVDDLALDCLNYFCEQVLHPSCPFPLRPLLRLGLPSLLCGTSAGLTLLLDTVGDQLDQSLFTFLLASLESGEAFPELIVRLCAFAESAFELCEALRLPLQDGDDVRQRREHTCSMCL
jgi:hypothetical protein